MLRKSIVALAVAGALTATPALAADKGGPVPVLQEIMGPSASSSCYVQAMAGAGIIASNPDGAVLPASISTQSYSVSGGFGCDMKLDRFVIGALARISAPIDTSGSLIEAEKSWMAAARVGYLLNTGLLVYGLAGYESTDFTVANIDLQRDGLVVGGGLEIALSKSLSLTTEYTYSGLGKTSALGPQLDTEQHTVRVGLSYRFGTLFGD